MPGTIGIVLDGMLAIVEEGVTEHPHRVLPFRVGLVVPVNPNPLPVVQLEEGLKQGAMWVRFDR